MCARPENGKARAGKQLPARKISNSCGRLILISQTPILV